MALAGGLLGCGDGGDETVTPSKEGALIATTLDGRVGYLLDELPQGVRERVSS